MERRRLDLSQRINFRVHRKVWKMNPKLEFWTSGIIITLLTASLISIAVLTKNSCDSCSFCQSIYEYGERAQMLDPSIIDRIDSNGWYFGTGYYCVWTKNRTLQEINRTDGHEVCHSLVLKDDWNYDHFCCNKTYSCQD